MALAQGGKVLVGELASTEVVTVTVGLNVSSMVTGGMVTVVAVIPRAEQADEY